MIKVSVLYPNGADTTFDMDYYLAQHMPMVKSKLGTVCKGIAVEHGLGGGQPGSSPAFIAMGHLYFDSVDAFQQAFGTHAEAIVADIPNYTNAQPMIQVSEVKLQ
jgi:uncharacterized protein (TIGR02118 family)